MTQPNEWTPRKRIENQYRLLINQLVDRYLNLPDSATLGQINEALVQFSTLTRFFTRAAETLAARMVSQVKKENAKSWRAAAQEGSRGRDIYAALREEMTGNVGQRVMELVAENAQLISSIPEHLRVQVNREIYRAQMAGSRPERIAQYLRKRIPHLTNSRSALIARTESSKAATALTRARSEDLNIPAYLWATSQDQRVRDSHRIMNGVVIFWHNPPDPEALIGETSYGAYHAGNIFNCFPGELEVNLSNGCDKLWRRKYAGPIVHLRLSDGTVLQATPNHPILTRRGWLPVNALQEGDYLVKSKLNAGVSAEDNHDRFVKFSNLFESLKLQVGAEASPSSEFDFHGDGSEHEVDIVNVDRFLLNALVAASLQCGIQFSFARTQVRNHRLSAKSSCGFNFDAVGRILPSLMGSLGKLFSLMARQSGHSDDIGLSGIADGNFCGDEHLSNGSSITAEFDRQREFTSSASIESDNFRSIEISRNRATNITADLQSVSAEAAEKSILLAWNDLRSGGHRHPIFDSIVKIDRKFLADFVGHVYNLQTKTGWYSVTRSNIISHNCRCDSYPILDWRDLKWPHRVFWGGRIQSMTLGAVRQLALAA